MARRKATKKKGKDMKTIFVIVIVVLVLAFVLFMQYQKPVVEDGGELAQLPPLGGNGGDGGDGGNGGDGQWDGGDGGDGGNGGDGQGGGGKMDPRDCIIGCAISFDNPDECKMKKIGTKEINEYICNYKEKNGYKECIKKCEPNYKLSDEDELYVLINRYRQCNMRETKESKIWRKEAQKHSAWMMRENEFFHSWKRLGYKNIEDWVDEGFPTSWHENIALDDSACGVLIQWHESKPHRNNLLLIENEYLGVGVKGRYWTSIHTEG